MENEYLIKKSPWVFHLCTGGCNGCDIEILALLSPKYDLERFGGLLKGSPKHADIILITGPLTEKSMLRALRVYESVPNPKKVIAVGSCAISTGIFKGERIKGPADKKFKIDMYVPGCPPRPEAILAAIFEVLKTDR